MRDIALRELEIARAFELGAVHGADHRAIALAEVIKTGADGKATIGEGGLRASVDDLQEELAHGGIDGVTDEVSVEGFKQRFAGEDFACHGSGMRHARATDGLD